MEEHYINMFIDPDEINYNNIGEVNKCLEELERRKDQNENQYQEILDKYTQINNQFLDYCTKFEQINICNKVSGDVNKIQQSAQTIDQLTQEIDKLHVGKVNIENVIRKVDDMSDMTGIAKLISVHMSNQEYEKAAQLVHRYLNIDERLLKEMLFSNKNSDNEIENIDELTAVFGYLKSIKLELQIIFQNQIQNILYNVENTLEDDSNFKLFEMVRLVELKKEGLDYFIKYNITKIKLATNLNIIDSNVTLTEFKDHISCVLQIYANNVKKCYQFLSVYYEPGDFVQYIREIHKSCLYNDFQILNEILCNKFYMDNIIIGCNKLTAILKNNTSIDLPNMERTNEIVKFQDFNQIIEFLTIFLSYYHVYEKFLNDLFHEHRQHFLPFFLTNSNESNINSLSRNFEKFDKFVITVINDNQINLLLEKLTKWYIDLIKCTIAISYHKAIQFDKTDEDIKSPSVVDDVFYILSSNIIKSANIIGLNKINLANIKIAHAYLQNDFTKYIKRLTEHSTSSLYYDFNIWLPLPKNAPLVHNATFEFMIGLNTIWEAIEHLNILLSQLPTILKLDDNLSNDEIKIAIHNLNSIKESWTHYLNDKILCFVDQCLLEIVNDSLTNILCDKYSTIDEKNLADLDITQNLRGVREIFDSIHHIFKQIAHSSIIDQIYGALSRALCTKLKSFICNLSINRFGAMLLESLLRQFVRVINQVTGFPSNIFFDDCLQLVELMSLEMKIVNNEDTLIILQSSVSPIHIIKMLDNRNDVPSNVKSHYKKLLL